MAVDLEAIRRRVQELSGNRRNSSVQLWKPEIGEYKVRGLPWKNAPDGMPFIERWFYYIGNNPGIVAPHQFGKADPINDLIRKLYSSGKPDDRLLAKKLQPKMRAYMPVIVRGQEDKGVQVWAFGKPIYQRLLGFFTEEDVGDILDPLEGFDLKVSITHTPGKMFMGKPSLDTVVDPARRTSKLSEDPAQAKTWLDSVPNLDDMYKLKSVQEIETLLNNWLNGGEAMASESDGSSKGASPSGDELDKLVDEVKGASAPASQPTPEAKADKPAKGKGKKAAAAADVDEEVPVEKKSLDDAFAELMKDDE
jgi:hypothetical protein